MDIYNGLFERLKKIKSISALGTGRQVGSLAPHSQSIALQLLLYVMKHEMLENDQRSKEDLIHYTKEILNRMALQGAEEEIISLVESIIHYGAYERGESFSFDLYNEKTGRLENFSFRYLVTDKEASQLEKGGRSIYRLTDLSKEIIFMTREILDEYGFSVEQFYVSQLIKNGNFTDARGAVDNLIMKVKDLIKDEEVFYENIIRNPRNIFLEHRRLNSKVIKQQFEEETEVFEKMFKWKTLLLKSESDEKKKAGEEIFEKLEYARVLHDVLAEKVIENMELKIRIRSQYPDLLWQQQNYSFKEHIWEGIIDQKGLDSMDTFEKILAPLFSPEIDFIYPLDWAWQSQQTQFKEEKSLEDLQFEVDEGYQGRPVNFDLIKQLFKPIFEKLQSKGSFDFGTLDHLTNEEKEAWLSQRINIELLMMYAMTPIVLKRGKYSDLRLKLFNDLLSDEPKFNGLVGKKIHAKLTGTPIQWEVLEVSPYKLYLEEVADE
jgi:hypothetical protein